MKVKKERSPLDIASICQLEWMTIEEAAVYLRTTPGSLRARVQAREIPHYRDDSGKDKNGREQGKITFLRTELLEWRKGHRVGTFLENVMSLAERQ